MAQRHIGPGWIVVSILAVLACLFALVTFDTRLTSGPFNTDPDLSSADLAELYERQSYAYAVWTLDNARLAFEWNARSNKYIFWLSVIITVSGVVFAFWQFAAANQFDRASEGRDELEFRTQMASLSFKTRSVAALVLAVSIIYLLIYVGFLYNIRVVEGVLEDLPQSSKARVLENVTGEVMDAPVLVPPEVIGAE